MKSHNSSKDVQPNLPGVSSKQPNEQASLPGMNGTQQTIPGDSRYYLSAYVLDYNDILKLGIFDTYKLHQIVYSLFERIRKPEETTCAGILHADLGIKKGKRTILILSNREPGNPVAGTINKRLVPTSFPDDKTYRFRITVNPVIRDNQSKKIIPVKGREAIEKWFMNKASANGFEILPPTLQTFGITVDRFPKGNSAVILQKATLTGILEVRDKELFSKAVHYGIGRGKAFGCGLLQIAPVSIKIL